MPAKARGLADTDDLVQIPLLRVLKQLERFEPRHEGAFLAYLRRILINAMRNEIARAATRGQQEEIGEGMAAGGPSPLESVLGKDMLDRYEAAFAQVYRGWDTTLQREVALKLRRADLEVPAFGARRWIEEARRLARVRHPHVLAILGADEHEGRVGLWTELVHGSTLEQWIIAQGALGAREAAGVGIDLLGSTTTTSHPSR